MGVSHANKNKRQPKQCACCERTFRGSFTSRGFFCSNQCQRDHDFQVAYEMFIAGRECGFKEPRSIKRLVQLRDGYSCSMCGLEQWQDAPIVLELEHKNGDGTDDTPTNLCLLCPNCHSQTPTFKGRNRGFGRPGRRPAPGGIV